MNTYTLVSIIRCEIAADNTKRQIDAWTHVLNASAELVPYA